MDETETTVRYELTIEDYREMTAHLCAKVAGRASRASLFLAMPLVFVATYNLASDGSDEWAKALAKGMLVGLALLPIHSVLVWRKNRATQKQLEPRPGSAQLTSYTTSIGEDALLIETPTWHSTMRWSAFTGFEESKGLLLLVIDANAAYAVPKRAFRDPARCSLFRAELERHIAARAASQGSALLERG